MLKIVGALLLLLSGCSPVSQVAAFSVPGQVKVVEPAKGAAIQLWQDASIFNPVTSLISVAEKRVWVEMYEFGRRDIAQLLVQRQRAGADVRVIVDPSVGVSELTAMTLRRSGICVRFYPIDDRRHQIDHVKLLLADGAAVVGGMNWGSHSSFNHDYAFVLHSARVLARLTAIFVQDWLLAGGMPAPLPPLMDAVAQTAPGGEVRRHLERDIVSARNEIRAEIFVLTDLEVIAELANAARRHVVVEVLMDPNQAVNDAAYSLLADAGVGVRWYPIPAGAKLHAKAGLFDSTLLLGSANWSLNGLSVNHELDVETSDPASVATFAARFDADWARAGSPWSCC